MKARACFVTALVMLAAASWRASSQEGGARGTAGDKATGKTPTARPPELRKPGFLFLELGTRRLDESVAFFESVAHFRLTRREARYAEMQSDLAELLLIHPDQLPKGHPFHERLTGSGQGLGVEIGLVVADLDQTYAAALKHKDWRISAGIALRPWGVRDFRVLSPDGYYLRFTEPPK